MKKLDPPDHRIRHAPFDLPPLHFSGIGLDLEMQPGMRVAELADTAQIKSSNLKQLARSIF
jgi:hypothetical protein